MGVAFLGIDSGTQSTKALLVEADTGRILSLGRAPHPLIAETPGQKEQQPQWWIDALIQAVKEALDAAPGVEVLGIGVSGQQHGLVILDENDAVLRPAKLWNDVTCAPQCERLMDQLGGREATICFTGNLILPGYTAGKVLWVREHEPEIYSRMRWILLPHDFLNLWLTGERFMEYGDASGTGFFNVRRRHWSHDVLVALDPSRDLEACLPPLVENNRVAGRLRPAAAQALGLPAGIPVSTGGGDNMMAAIGTGNIQPGAVTVSLGTSGTIFAYAEAAVVDPDGELAAFCDSTGAWLPLVCTMNVTTATEMVHGWFNLEMSDLTRQAGQVPAGADDLLFLPYSEGERTPNMPGATGVLYGLRGGVSSPGHLMRAAMEGTTLGLRYGLDILRRLGIVPQKISVTGGGGQNPVWRQICADVFGTPVVHSVVDEAAAYGAALQARWAVACDRSRSHTFLSEIATPWMAAMQEVTSQEPHPESVQRYDEVYSLFRRLTDQIFKIP